MQGRSAPDRPRYWRQQGRSGPEPRLSQGRNVEHRSVQGPAPRTLDQRHRRAGWLRWQALCDGFTRLSRAIERIPGSRRDSVEADPVARRHEEHRVTSWMISSRWRSTEKMPSAGSRKALDRCLKASNRDGACWCRKPRLGAPGGCDTRIETSEVSVARHETEHVDAILSRGVAGNYFVGGQSVLGRDGDQVFAE